MRVKGFEKHKKTKNTRALFKISIIGKKTQKHKKHRVLLFSHEKQKTKTQKDMSTSIIPLLLKNTKTQKTHRLLKGKYT